MSWREHRRWVKSVKAIVNQVNDSIQYIPEPKDQNHWQCPLETVERAAGDCEDIGLLFRQCLFAAGLIEQSEMLCGYDERLKDDHAVLRVWKGGKSFHICNANGYRGKLRRFRVGKVVSDYMLDMIVENSRKKYKAQTGL